MWQIFSPSVVGPWVLAVSGAVVTGQNFLGSLDRDLMRATDKFGGPFTPPGFYYKTFIRPRRLWPLYEKILRNAAGLGKRFHREALTAARLKHPSIIDVYAVGSQEEIHYFAMELVEGTPLDRWIEARRREDRLARGGPRERVPPAPRRPGR